MNPSMRHFTTVVALLATSACVIGNEKYPRPRDLEESWLVDRSRLLAVAAEPPEIRPGETARFSALFPQPDQDEPWARIWLACPVEDGGAGFGCELDLGGTGTGLTGGSIPEGFIGFEPGLPPEYTAPTDLLDGIVDERERTEGVQILAQVSALPTEVLDDPSADIDFNEIEAGFKRLVVSEASTPNNNPLIDAFVVDRLAIPVDAVVHVTGGQRYELGVILEEALVEEYEYLTRDGVVELREEEPWAAWYTTGGDMLEPVTLYPYNEATWEAPKNPGEDGTWYVVVRDRRGGMTWHEQDWVVDQ